MMPVVRINDATFADLSTLKTWFGTKTATETIDRIVREAMEQLGIERDDAPQDALRADGGEAMQFASTPGLAFTKPLAATVAGQVVKHQTWLAILLATIAQVKAKGVTGERLVRELAIQARAEPYEEEGFRYHPELGISVQGQSAPDCWKEADRLARKWRIPVTVEFMWRQNPKAQFPGKTGILRSGTA